MNKVTLITGGGRSGKSTHALWLAMRCEGKRAFVATAEAFDAEMSDRIAAHRKERGDAFMTVEEPLDPARILTGLPDDICVAVVDCLTVWLGNLMHHRPGMDERYPEVSGMMNVLMDPPCDLIIVTNEVGMGIVPIDGMSRRFRDMAGRINQEAAALADTVILMVCGIPVVVKGDKYGPA